MRLICHNYRFSRLLDLYRKASGPFTGITARILLSIFSMHILCIGSLLCVFLNMENLIVQNNIFYSLRQPAYLNPNTTGHIVDNVVYNTRGFVVDGAVFVFSGNSWGSPENAADTALLVGTLTGPPYDPLTDLSANNSDALIDDQR